MSTGCAVSYVDSKNVRHVIGFVDVALPSAPAEANGPTPSVVSVTSLGVHVYSGTANGSARKTMLSMPNVSSVTMEITPPKRNVTPAYKITTA